MEAVIIVPLVMGTLFIGLPWLILHYLTKWKQAPGITDEDEKLLDELYMLARRLDDRLATIERIVAADHPEFRPTTSFPEAPAYDLSRRN